MTTHHKDLCRCGSGKRYKHCHLPADQAKARRNWIAGIGALALLLVGAAAWGAYAQWQERRARELGVPVDSLRAQGMVLPGGGGDVAGSTAPVPSGAFGGVVPGAQGGAPIPATAGARIPMGSSSSSAVAPGENPTPWQYDVAKNRHYDPRPGHGHWHNGPPPSDTTQAGGITTSGGPTPTVSVGGGGTVNVTGGAGGLTPTVTTRTTPITSGSTPLAPGENPAPWEYDKAKDRHFDPRDAHRHWHAGPPPPPAERGK